MVTSMNFDALDDYVIESELTFSQRYIAYQLNIGWDTTTSEHLGFYMIQFLSD